jgi:hypothetical protein
MTSGNWQRFPRLFVIARGVTGTNKHAKTFDHSGVSADIRWRTHRGEHGASRANAAGFQLERTPNLAGESAPAGGAVFLRRAAILLLSVGLARTGMVLVRLQ